jgi:hypothetical protein
MSLRGPILTLDLRTNLRGLSLELDTKFSLYLRPSYIRSALWELGDYSELVGG